MDALPRGRPDFKASTRPQKPVNPSFPAISQPLATGVSQAMKKSHPNVQNELNRLQFGPSEKFILVEQLEIGYGGQISRRLLGLKLALALERKAIFKHHADPPYLQTFEPQYSNAPDFDWNSGELFNPLESQRAAVLRFEYSAVRRILEGPDNIEAWAESRVATRFNLADDANVDGELLKWMRLLPAVQSEIDAALSRLGVSSKTLGVHLRRGDKTTETAYVPAYHFNDAIAQIYRTWPFESIFLASDSPGAAAEVDLPQGVKLIFDSDEKRYNNANHKMLFRNPDLAKQETFTAAKNFALLCACGGIVGQDNAHFATLSSAIIASNFCKPERIVLLDGRLAELESPSVRMYFHLTRTFRSVVRACIPNKWRRKLVLWFFPKIS
jgi:hypothetical protein